MTSQIINIESANNSFHGNKNFVYQSKNAYFDMTNFVARYANELTNDRGMLVSDIVEKLDEMNITMSLQMIGKVFQIFCDKTDTKVDSKHVTFYKLKPEIEVPESVLEEQVPKVESDESILKDNLHINTHINKESKPFDIYVMITLAYLKTDNFQTYASTSRNMKQWPYHLLTDMITSNDKLSFADKWLVNKKLARVIPGLMPLKTTFKIDEDMFKACIQLVISMLDSKYKWSVDVKNRYEKHALEQRLMAEKEKQQRLKLEEEERQRRVLIEQSQSKTKEEIIEEFKIKTHKENAERLHINYDEYMSFYNKYHSRFDDPVEYYLKLHKYDGKDLTTFHAKKSNKEADILLDDYKEDFIWIRDELLKIEPESPLCQVFDKEIHRREQEIETKLKTINERNKMKAEDNIAMLERARMKYINFCENKAKTKPYFSMFGKERFRKIHWDKDRQILWYSKNQRDEDDDRHPIIIYKPPRLEHINFNNDEEVRLIISFYQRIQDPSHVWKDTLKYIEKQKKNANNSDPVYMLGNLIMDIIKQEVKTNNQSFKKLLKEESESNDEE